MPRKAVVRATRELSHDQQKIFDVLNTGTDLAAVLVGAAFLDQCLGALLRARFLKSSVSTRLLEPARGILGQFSARADLAYALGLLRKSIYQDVQKIGEIRNRFAHSHFGMTLADDEIAPLCDELKYFPTIERSLVESGGSPMSRSVRDRFSLSIVMICSRILVETLSHETRAALQADKAQSPNDPS